MNLLTAKAMGASQVFITGTVYSLTSYSIDFRQLISDIDEERLKKAASLGATGTILVNPKEDAKTLSQRVIDTMHGHSDVTIECSGAESSIQTAIYVQYLQYSVANCSTNIQYSAYIVVWYINR